MTSTGFGSVTSAMFPSWICSVWNECAVYCVMSHSQRGSWSGCNRPGVIGWFWPQTWQTPSDGRPPRCANRTTTKQNTIYTSNQHRMHLFQMVSSFHSSCNLNFKSLKFQKVIFIPVIFTFNYIPLNGKNSPKNSL